MQIKIDELTIVCTCYVLLITISKNIKTIDHISGEHNKSSSIHNNSNELTINQEGYGKARQGGNPVSIRGRGLYNLVVTTQYSYVISGTIIPIARIRCFM